MDQDYQGAPVPPPELVKEWLTRLDCPDEARAKAQYIATQAACWGADQELEACCEWMANRYGDESHAMGLLRAARRPKPPSLKAQALADFFDGLMSELDGAGGYSNCAERIRRALEQLDD